MPSIRKEPGTVVSVRGYQLSPEEEAVLAYTLFNTSKRLDQIARHADITEEEARTAITSLKKAGLLSVNEVQGGFWDGERKYRATIPSHELVDARRKAKKRKLLGIPSVEELMRLPRSKIGRILT